MWFWRAKNQLLASGFFLFVFLFGFCLHEMNPQVSIVVGGGEVQAIGRQVKVAGIAGQLDAMKILGFSFFPEQQVAAAASDAGDRSSVGTAGQTPQATPCSPPLERCSMVAGAPVFQSKITTDGLPIPAKALETLVIPLPASCLPSAAENQATKSADEGEKGFVELDQRLGFPGCATCFFASHNSQSIRLAIRSPDTSCLPSG